jgi:hypothetical protein
MTITPLSFIGLTHQKTFLQLLPFSYKFHGANREIILGLFLTPEKTKSYNRGWGYKNGPKFETLHSD